MLCCVFRCSLPVMKLWERYEDCVFKTGGRGGGGFEVAARLPPTTSAAAPATALGQRGGATHVIWCALCCGVCPALQVLRRLLQDRYEDYVSKTGGRGGPVEAAAREAVQAAFRHAAALNAHALVAGLCTRTTELCS
jgi:hypothetical protein